MEWPFISEIDLTLLMGIVSVDLHVSPLCSEGPLKSTERWRYNCSQEEASYTAAVIWRASTILQEQVSERPHSFLQLVSGYNERFWLRQESLGCTRALTFMSSVVATTLNTHPWWKICPTLIVPFHFYDYIFFLRFHWNCLVSNSVLLRLGLVSDIIYLDYSPTVT